MAIVPTPRQPLPTHAVVPTPLNPATLVDALQTPFERFRARYPAYVANLRALRSYREAQLDGLAARSPAEQRGHVRKLLRDRRLYSLYAYEAVRRAGRLVPATPQTIEELAARCNPFAPVRDERVVMRAVDKGSGHRWVQDFGPRRRMQQALVAAILRKLHPSSRTQTLFAGGVPAARKAVATAYHEEGMRYGVEVDFVDFYGSIAPDGLAELLRPLPATVVEHVIWDVAMRDDPSLSVVVGNTAHPTLSAPSGLSLGASTSPVVGERVIARLLAVAQLPETITYADNLFVMARTEAEVRERIHRLGGSIAAASFGALRLREGFTYGYDLSRPFEFMKQEGRVRDRSLMIDAGIDWSPSEAKQDQYRISAVERRLTLAEIAAAERRVGQWRRSYPTWPDGDEREAEYLAGLAARRYYVESSPANLSSAIHAVVVAFHAAGGMSSYAELVPTEGDPSGERRQELLTELARWLDNAARRARPLALR